LFFSLSYLKRDGIFQKLIDDLVEIYPSANVWLVGHSLGGALASLLGATYGLPAVAFESPGEKLAASRLHLPLPPPISDSITLPQTSSIPFRSSPALSPAPPPSLGHHPIATTHVYHNADPIPQGACTGFGSPCTHAGYALETRCHLGKSVVFDTVGKLGWSVSVRHHVIRGVVMDVLGADDVWWGDDDDDPARIGIGDGTEINTTRNVGGKNKRNVPKATIEEGCIVCLFLVLSR
jgi:lipase ATG15